MRIIMASNARDTGHRLPRAMTNEEVNHDTVEHLTKCYGDFVAVDDLSFEIGEGHVYGFLGPNGAGKSTTMNT